MNVYSHFWTISIVKPERVNVQPVLATSNDSHQSVIVNYVKLVTNLQSCKFGNDCWTQVTYNDVECNASTKQHANNTVTPQQINN